MRVLILHHMTFSINSLCHVFGRRPFATDDESRNLVWLAPFAFGESWHNNHHAFPTSARHGLGRRQLDLSAWLITGLERCHLAWDVVRISPGHQQAKRGVAPRPDRGTAMTATVHPARAPAPPRRTPVVVALGSNALLGGGGAADAAVRGATSPPPWSRSPTWPAITTSSSPTASGPPGTIAHQLEQGLNAALPGREIATVHMRSVVDAAELRTIRWLLAEGALVICAAAGRAAWSSTPPRRLPWRPPSTTTSPLRCSRPASAPRPC